jgi:[ribosomal protein S5]-alanine N-acetyltransferase
LWYHFKEDLQCKNAELGYWIAEPFWGNGIITSVIKERVQDAFTKHNIHRLYASVFDENMASQKALLKCGFTLEAVLKQAIYKNGKYHDDYIFSLLNPNSST